MASVHHDAAPAAAAEPVAADASGFASGAMNALYEHAFSTPDVESAGVLVGRRGDQEMAQINAVIPAVRASVPGEHAVLSHQAWAYVHSAMARHYPTQEIVGWYVSRPYGTAMTTTDVAVHRNYFPSPDQLAVVFDAHRRMGGMYQLHGDHVVQIYEGPVAHHYQPRRPAPQGPPWRGIALLAVLGFILGSVLWLAAAVIGIA